MGVGVGRQLKVTAHCHATVQSHYPSCRLRRRSPPPHDGQMTIIPALLFAAVSSSAGTHLFLRFAPIYICESVKLHCWLECQSLIFFSFFCHLSKLFGRVNEDSQVRYVYPASPIYPVFSQKKKVGIFSRIRRGEGLPGKVPCPGQYALCVSKGAGRQKGDLGRQQGLLLLTAPLQARQAISRGDGRNAPAIVFDSDLHTRAGKSQTN